jgi:hypothetical protein
MPKSIIVLVNTMMRAQIIFIAQNSGCRFSRRK